MNYHLTRISGNVKTGTMPVTTSNKNTCPTTCPLKDAGCYARFGALGMHWKQVSNGSRGGSWAELMVSIKALPKRTLWRHNQAGDLVGNNNNIDTQALKELVTANKGKNGFTYTHYPVLDNENNKQAVKNANDNGFTINLSAETLNQVDSLVALKVGPVVTVMAVNAPKVSYTPGGNKVVICPAQTNDKTTCLACGLCQLKDRDYVIGFRAHGSAHKKAQSTTFA